VSSILWFALGAFVGGVVTVSSAAAAAWFKKQRDSAVAKVEGK